MNTHGRIDLGGRFRRQVLYQCVCVLALSGITAATGKAPMEARPLAEPVDYARVVRVSFASLPESDNVRYYDRVTGRHLKELPVLPVSVCLTPGGWFCPARSGSGGTGKFGFIDRRGNWIIRPQFTRAGSFICGRAIVSVDKKDGVIDDAGRWVVKPGAYDKLYSYVEARAPFRLKGKWGYLGLDGQVAVPARYKDANYFSHGVALVEDGMGWHVIDRMGKTRFRLAGRPDGYSFVHGLLLVDTDTMTRNESRSRSLRLSKFGYLGTDGRIAIPLQFDFAEEFSEGLAVVARWRSAVPDSGKNNGEHGEEDAARPADEQKGNDLPGYLYGAIDVKGRVVVPIVYDSLSVFRGGLAAFRRGRGKWGYLDRRGKEVIPPRFSSARPFFDGLAEVAIDGKVALIDLTGRVVIRTGLRWEEF